jgi:hypothetical protein
MRHQTPTEKQKAKIRINWARITRLGLPLFTLLVGTALLIWIGICFAGFDYLLGNQRLLHESWYIKGTLQFAAVLSYAFPLAYYAMLRMWIKRIGSTEA